MVFQSERAISLPHQTFSSRPGDDEPLHSYREGAPRDRISVGRLKDLAPSDRLERTGTGVGRGGASSLAQPRRQSLGFQEELLQWELCGEEGV